MAENSAYLQIFSRLRGGFPSPRSVADVGTLIAGAQASLLDRGDVNEHVFAAAVGLNK